MSQPAGPSPPELPPSAAEPLPGQTDPMAELAALAGGLAHEIRNSLSTLRMNLQLLREDWEADDSATPPDARPDPGPARRNRKRLDVLLKEAARLETILEDFLEFVNKRELNRAPCALNELVGELVDFYQPQADAHGIVLAIEGADPPPVCDIDANLIKQALLNLLINAQQAMCDGGRLTIRVSAESEATARIDVIDTGPGIPPEQLDRIFEAYHSTRKGGTGLGLTTTRRIVREHGGRIHVRSEVHKGTCFSVLLPRVAEG